MNDDAELPQTLLKSLQAAPEGLSEYALLQQLKQANCPLLPTGRLSDPLVLFRSHFILFNALYRLRDQLWQSGRYHLQISPLCIRLCTYSKQQAALSEHDPLRSYYLDLQHLADTDAAQVNVLLASFWNKAQGTEQKAAALELLGLGKCDESISLGQIKQRYRQMVSLHHPDRGGSTERLQSLNAAMEILQKHYKHSLESNSL